MRIKILCLAIIAILIIVLLRQKPSYVVPWRCVNVSDLSDKQVFEEVTRMFNDFLKAPIAVPAKSKEGYYLTLGKKLFPNLKQPVTSEQWRTINRGPNTLYSYVMGEPAIFITIGDDAEKGTDKNIDFFIDGCGLMYQSTSGISNFRLSN